MNPAGIGASRGNTFHAPALPSAAEKMEPLRSRLPPQTSGLSTLCPLLLVARTTHPCVLPAWR